MSCLFSLGGWEVHADGRFRTKDGAGNVRQLSGCRKRNQTLLLRGKKRSRSLDRVQHEIFPHLPPSPSLPNQYPGQVRTDFTSPAGTCPRCPAPSPSLRPHSRAPLPLHPRADPGPARGDPDPWPHSRRSPPPGARSRPHRPSAFSAELDPRPHRPVPLRDNPSRPQELGWSPTRRDPLPRS